MKVLLCLACLALMVVFIIIEHKEKYVPAVILKGAASLCFVILGLITSRMCGDARFAKLVVTGLVLGMAADILLNLRFVFEKNGKLVFLVGILVFLSGHILYLCALIPGCRSLAACIAAGVVLTALILWWIFRRITAPKAFKIFGIFYIGAIVIMNCVAFGVLLADPCAGTGVFFAGAVAFLISDVVLILNTFGSETKFSMRITNLSLYYIGQLLIALSLMLL